MEFWPVISCGLSLWCPPSWRSQYIGYQNIIYWERLGGESVIIIREPWMSKADRGRVREALCEEGISSPSPGREVFRRGKRKGVERRVDGAER